MEKSLTQHTSEHFIEFMLACAPLAQCQYRHEKQIKAGTKAFQILVRLMQNQDQDYTMSSLAEDFKIAKQQMTRLVNDLEEKGLVQRRHDSRNRRFVYLQISECGVQLIQELKQQMLSSTEHAFTIYTEEELKEMDDCLIRLKGYLQRFQIKE